MVCAALVLGLPHAVVCAERAAAQRVGCCAAAEVRRGGLPMGVARLVGAADQPGSRRRTTRGVVLQARGEGACDEGSGWRIGGPSGGRGVGVVRHAVPIMTRRRPCCRFARVVGDWVCGARCGCLGHGAVVCCSACVLASSRVSHLGSYSAHCLLLLDWAGRCRGRRCEHGGVWCACEVGEWRGEERPRQTLLGGW